MPAWPQHACGAATLYVLTVAPTSLPLFATSLRRPPRVPHPTPPAACRSPAPQVRHQLHAFSGPAGTAAGGQGAAQPGGGVLHGGCTGDCVWVGWARGVGGGWGWGGGRGGHTWARRWRVRCLGRRAGHPVPCHGQPAAADCKDPSSLGPHISTEALLQRCSRLIIAGLPADRANLSQPAQRRLAAHAQRNVPSTDLNLRMAFKVWLGV
jgi:hypothetical protein